MKLRRLLQYPLAILPLLAPLVLSSGCNKPQSPSVGKTNTTSVKGQTTPTNHPGVGSSTTGDAKTPSVTPRTTAPKRPGTRLSEPNRRPQMRPVEPVGRERFKRLLLAQRQRDGLGNRLVLRRNNIRPNPLRMRTPDQQAMRKPLFMKIEVTPKDAQIEVLRNDVRVSLHKANNGRLIVRNLPAGGVTTISKTPILFQYKLRVFREGYFDRELNVPHAAYVQKTSHVVYQTRVMLRPRRK
ncbi:MAG: hypothetical protein KC609_26480 [Myxococcales bacterium]|nr:hypothetical protein [Myxococcales bacterium]